MFLFFMKERKKCIRHEDPGGESRETISESVDLDQKPDIEAVKMETEELVSTTPEPRASPVKSSKHSDACADGGLMVADAKTEEVDQSRANVIVLLLQ